MLVTYPSVCLSTFEFNNFALQELVFLSGNSNLVLSYIVFGRKDKMSPFFQMAIIITVCEVIISILNMDIR